MHKWSNAVRDMRASCLKRRSSLVSSLIILESRSWFATILGDKYLRSDKSKYISSRVAANPPSSDDGEGHGEGEDKEEEEEEEEEEEDEEEEEEEEEDDEEEEEEEEEEEGEGGVKRSSFKATIIAFSSSLRSLRREDVRGIAAA